MTDEKGFFHPELGYWQTVGGNPIIGDYAEGTLEVPLKPGENYNWENGAWVYVEPEPDPEPLPDEISRRQFFQQLANMDIITRAEALAAFQGGAIPAPLQVIIDALPTEDAQFDAAMLVSGAQTFNRLHLLAETVRQAMQWTVEQKDNFWIAAYKL